MATQRYQIIELSQSAHCCFGYTVVDTENPSYIGDQLYIDHRTGGVRYEAVCECFSEEDANLICNALNSL